MKAIKITNTHWLNSIVPQIEDFCNKCKSPGIYPQTLAASLHQTIQFGGGVSEVWCVFDDNEPVAFTRWMVAPLPYVGTVTSDVTYSKSVKRNAIDLLIDEYIKFARKHNANLIYTTIYQKKIWEYYTKKFEDTGFMVDATVNPVQINGVWKITNKKKEG